MVLAGYLDEQYLELLNAVLKGSLALSTTQTYTKYCDEVSSDRPSVRPSVHVLNLILNYQQVPPGGRAEVKLWLTCEKLGHFRLPVTIEIDVSQGSWRKSLSRCRFYAPWWEINHDVSQYFPSLLTIWGRDSE